MITNVGEDVENMEPLCTFDGKVNWCSHSGKEYEGSSKIEYSTTFWSSNPTAVQISKRNETTILKRLLHPISPSLNDGVVKANSYCMTDCLAVLGTLHILINIILIANLWDRQSTSHSTKNLRPARTIRPHVQGVADLGHEPNSLAQLCALHHRPWWFVSLTYQLSSSIDQAD